ncbi:Bcr/CflA family drug resistance efflux transporter [Stutzerimonas nosocomialis]|uniref:Bcr/CflA family efflux transporter n=1 Tax=Stutzerimonas nosocomialis TaxID=1056496 RepID=A0A5R9QHA7_9GAMM|nr:multidrug effflux MFS transporter [Stutzerimonas nosocomialis]TLX64262.1 Bcr/CflA family drug resistance efflux transporter [Stutzerimonas nosocomialis]
MPLRILLILGALSAFGPLAIDFYLPAFPAIAQAFDTHVEHVQQSLAAYFIGLAIGQLIYGPLADRYGRRRPLLLGVTLFTLASLACSFAPSMDWLIGARFVQALGGCAGMVVARAVVRDLCDPMASAKVFSQLMLVMGLAPILAPVLGGLLLAHLGWSSIFVALTLFSGACLIAVTLWLPETYPKGLPPAPMSGALGQYRRMFGDRQFLGNAMTGGFAMAGMFAYIAGSPFVFIELYGVAPQHYGWLFGINAVGFIVMAQVNARLMLLRGPEFWLQRWILVYFVSALVLLVVAALRPPMLWPLLIPLFVCISSLGCILPNATACAMAGQGANAGSASALLGCLQFSAAAGFATLVGLLHNGTAMPLAATFSLCGLLAVAVVRWTVRGRRLA